MLRLRKPERTRVGALRHNLPSWKDAIDYQLTRLPQLYLFVDAFLKGVNWDRRVYLSLVRRGDVVLDVGANVGAHTLFFSRLVGGSGRVLAFEPLSANVAEMQRTLSRRSRLNNVQIFPMALGEASSPVRVTLNIPGDDLTQASLRRQRAGSWDRNSVTECLVPLRSLDSIPEVAGSSHIDFVKIDVEGGELDVLKGAARTLATHHPVLYCELDDRWTASFGYEARDLFAFLQSLGYTGGRVVSRGRLHRLDLKLQPPKSLFEISSNVLFFGDQHQDSVNRFDQRYAN